MNECCNHIEPCHVEPCDGLNEIANLLPRGAIWNPDRGGVYGGYVNALGHIKTELNLAICQEQAELNPCTAKRLLPYWADLYKMPPCIEQSQENMCQWMDILYGDCPIGTQGFIKKAIDFVLPDAGVEVAFNLDITARGWEADKPCAMDKALIITAPAELYAHYEYDGDYPHEIQDGLNSCRRYFIPEIECLRPCVFPIGLSVGYLTTETGDYDINNAPDTGAVPRPTHTYICNTTTGALDDRVCN